MDDYLKILAKKLEDNNVFWSYKTIPIKSIPSDTLIEKVMLFLDIDDIRLLFRLYNKEKIREVWERNILMQEPYYHGLNRFFAWFYFDIENPDKYIDDFVAKRDTLKD